ncbi:sigma-E processing peptidase SpoIIGA [Effusibacillus dendaii]|uniref:Sporulation sigma-E factor-processing peptidase n=1 Tax=Effusibacillus dendaii TaxID=2743772 RepID=A0A7I8D7J0_9BACL|nr:sigma-E processing peptidase SpoIIGA [Effusibacillus dendaii]BCJ86064.1 sporulation sigma-E factor-processing peptidase [Effusibacillus dendaii]
MKVLYADEVWLLNFIMDAAILRIAVWMAKSRVSWRRILAGALLGACYALLLFVPGATEETVSWFAKLLFSCVIVVITFAPKQPLDFIRCFGLFYLASFVVGGTAYAVNAFFAQSAVLGGMVVVSEGAVWSLNIRYFLILLSLPLAYIVGKSAWFRIRRFQQRQANLWKVIIHLDDKQVELIGLLDTGNGLTDPVSGSPVAVVEWQAIEEFLPDSLLAAYREKRDITLNLGQQAIEEEWQARLRIIPYRGVGGKVGMLLAFRPARLLVSQGAIQEEAKNILVAVNPLPLSNDHAYQAILPPACVSTTVLAS